MYLNYKHTVLPFTALCYSSRYLRTAGNELGVSHIHRKRFTSTLKNKVDILNMKRSYENAKIVCQQNSFVYLLKH